MSSRLGYDRGRLPEKAAFALVYEVPPELLHETFNAIEFEPPPIPGELVWVELLVK